MIGWAETSTPRGAGRRTSIAAIDCPEKEPNVADDWSVQLVGSPVMDHAMDAIVGTSWFPTSRTVAVKTWVELASTETVAGLTVVVIGPR